MRNTSSAPKLIEILCILNDNKLYPVPIEGGQLNKLYAGTLGYIIENEGREKFINERGDFQVTHYAIFEGTNKKLTCTPESDDLLFKS